VQQQQQQQQQTDSKDSQHVFSEAPLPFRLVEEVVEVAAEGDENKAESEESKDT